MGRLIDTYKHLDETDKFKVELSVPEVAAKICRQNYGAVRLLSAMVHELRKRNEAYKKEQESKGFGVEEDSPLAAGIEKLVNEGFYY